MLINASRLVLVPLLAALSAALPAAAQNDGTPEAVRVRAVAHFGPDSVRMDPRDRDALLAEVAKLGDVTWKTVTATGHTDSAGSDAYNERLGRQRADSVRRYLVGKGLSPQMIRTASASESAPVADNATAAGRALNRRAEVEFEGVRMMK
ncbi:OmpA family protein [Azohydromonas aeria]|uniref:OmpA family protein n=1 Tax=Azohydromonas aeria TaxID=2590212 RepID=UPI0012F77B07|nr:OmpA family protein [Azohydromonas aeria]